MPWTILDLTTPNLVRVPIPFHCDKLKVQRDIRDSEEVSRRIVMTKVKRES